MLLPFCYTFYQRAAQYLFVPLSLSVSYTLSSVTYIFYILYSFWLLLLWFTKKNHPFLRLAVDVIDTSIEMFLLRVHVCVHVCFYVIYIFFLPIQCDLTERYKYMYCSSFAFYFRFLCVFRCFIEFNSHHRCVKALCFLFSMWNHTRAWYSFLEMTSVPLSLSLAQTLTHNTLLIEK